MKILRTIIIISSLTFFLLSCATGPSLINEIDTSIEQDDFSAAAEVIRKAQESINVIYDENNAISHFMDIGLLEYYAGNYAASSSDLQNAEKLIEEAYSKSNMEGFLLYIVNSRTRDYPGEDFENIYLNIFNALNYYNRGDIEGALAETRKISMTDGKLDMLAQRYNYKEPKTGANLTDIVRRETGISEIPRAVTINFSNSALARYLSALFYQAAGNTDSARAEFDQIEKAFSANRTIYHNRVPAAVQQARNVSAGKARLNIISFTGLSPIKKETIAIHYLPFQNPVLKIASFKLPVLARRPGQITRIEVTVNDKERFDLELLEDMGSVIEETFALHYSNILIKTYIRTIIKYAVTDIALRDTANQKSELVGLLAAAGARAAMDASEGADIRMCRYLPEKAYIGGIDLNPGAHAVTINYYNGEDIIIREHREVIVNTGSPNLLQTVKLR